MLEMFNEGVITRHDAHPVHCHQSELMRCRTDQRPANDSWADAPGNERIAPLAAACFSRSLLTQNDNSATAIDLKDEENSIIGGLLASL